MSSMSRKEEKRMADIAKLEEHRAARQALKAAAEEVRQAVEGTKPEPARIAALVMNPDMVKTIFDLPPGCKIFGTDITEEGHPILLLEWEELPIIQPGANIPTLHAKYLLPEAYPQMQRLTWSQYENPHQAVWERDESNVMRRLEDTSPSVNDVPSVEPEWKVRPAEPVVAGISNGLPGAFDPLPPGMVRIVTGSLDGGTPDEQIMPQEEFLSLITKQQETILQPAEPPPDTLPPIA